MGISALGARRKLLRVFSIVREKMKCVPSVRASSDADSIEAPPGVNLAPPPNDADESASNHSPNPDESVGDISHTSDV